MVESPKIVLSLDELLGSVVVIPHPETRTGHLIFSYNAFNHNRTKTNVHISVPSSPGNIVLDLTGDITINGYTMIGDGTKIFTHDHFHDGRKEPLLVKQARKGVKWQSKTIGSDVWLHGCTILYQVTEIPDGVVVGAGSVLTKNPGPYEIWAGNPAKKIGER